MLTTTGRATARRAVDSRSLDSGEHRTRLEMRCPTLHGRTSQERSPRGPGLIPPHNTRTERPWAAPTTWATGPARAIRQKSTARGQRKHSVASATMPRHAEFGRRAILIIPLATKSIMASSGYTEKTQTHAPTNTKSLQHAKMFPLETTVAQTAQRPRPRPDATARQRAQGTERPPSNRGMQSGPPTGELCCPTRQGQRRGGRPIRAPAASWPKQRQG